jgi:tripartite-type tricarboxylate transporter receptor subunit TctC
LNISEKRKSRVGTPSIISKGQNAPRRLIEARLQGDPPRVKGTKVMRRQFLQLSCAAASIPVLSRRASALDYPTRPVRIIIGFVPGDSVDTVFRIVAQWLSERLGQGVIIENRPGAATTIALQAAINSPPDGFTLAHIASSTAVNATLYKTLSFNFLRDSTPVACLVNFPHVIVVHPSFPPRTFPEFIAYAKTNPGQINLASYGTGTVSHLAGELLKTMAGLNLVHVPYRGGAPAITDLISGRVQMFIGTLAATWPHVRSGALRVLAVTAKTRSDALPDVSTVAEFVSGYEVNAVAGIGAPKGTPPEIIERLNREINLGLSNRTVKARLVDMTTEPLPFTPGEFGLYMAAETEKWAKVINAQGIKAE